MDSVASLQPIAFRLSPARSPEAEPRVIFEADFPDLVLDGLKSNH